MSQKQILIVDDEQDVRIYLSRLFQENGYAVTCATDGNEALETVRKEKPDLITLDLSMPNKSGVKFYREIKSNPEFSGIRVVFVTGITGPGGPGDTQRFYATRRQVPPPDGFIAKPIDPAEIIALVGKLI
jgi:CheY-like chemotaxis protein